MKEQNRQYLLKLARKTLEYHFETNNKLIIEENFDQELKDKRGTFVTLTINNQLRGCIGHLEAIQPIYLDVIDNVLAAALSDNRFLPVRSEELGEIKIEISILTKPEELVYSSVSDLLNQIIPLRHGVIIQKNKNSATYLPQVWEELSDKEEFLSSLCLKAGLLPDEWQKGDLKVWVYEVEAFGE